MSYMTLSSQEKPLFQKRIPWQHLFFTLFVLLHASDNTTSQNIGGLGGGCMGRPPTSNFLGPSPLGLRPAVASHQWSGRLPKIVARRHCWYVTSNTDINLFCSERQWSWHEFAEVEPKYAGFVASQVVITVALSCLFVVYSQAASASFPSSGEVQLHWSRFVNLSVLIHVSHSFIHSFRPFL